MGIDNKIHNVHDFLLNDIAWNNYNPDIAEREGLRSASYYLWYYAQDQLYIIKDVMIDCCWFIKARSPYKALKMILDCIEEAEHAGEFVQEEYE